MDKNTNEQAAAAPQQAVPEGLTTREKFEAWASGKGWSIKPAREESRDDYMDTDTEIAWYGWQAAIGAAPANELPPLPGHPDPHTMQWTELEKRAIRQAQREAYELGRKRERVK